MQKPANDSQGLVPSKLQSAVLIILRFVIGWHFLYEGIAKLLTPDWTSAPYLSASRWIFSGFFHWMASKPALLRAVDLLNIWGLILIGLGLILGVFVRTASYAGVLLLIFYYVANPPFIGSDFGVPVEGHYLVVNKNLVEMMALFAVAIFPAGSAFQLGQFFRSLWKKAGKEPPVSDKIPDQAVVNQDASGNPFPRRELLRNLAGIPALGVFAYGAYRKYDWEKVNAITGATIKLTTTALQDLKGELPQGRIGNVTMSRLLLGCNLIGGWSHSRDLMYVPYLTKAYNSDRKVFETLEIAEQAGVNMMNVVSAQYPLVNKYLNITGGKMQTFCQVYPRLNDMTSDIDKAIDSGATMLYIQGGYCDRFVYNGEIDFLAKTIEYIKKRGYLGGVGAHSIQVPIACEKAGIDVDYYVKTFHHDNYWSAHPREFRKEFSVDAWKNPDHNGFHDNMFDLFPDQTMQFMQNCKKPWIAFKVLAAGAIKPQDGFEFAFRNGADFICVGMYDFQVVEDVNIAIDVLKNISGRTRPWMA